MTGIVRIARLMSVQMTNTRLCTHRVGKECQYGEILGTNRVGKESQYGEILGTHRVGNVSTVEPRYNAVVRDHDFGPRCTRGALGVLISATRELLNNSDRRLLHQAHECCQSPMCLQHCLIRQYACSL